MPRGIKVVKLDDFSGGLNLRDAPSELEDTESPDCMNVTCDERGGIIKRLGYSKYNEDELPGYVKYLFYSTGLELLIAQVDDELYTSDGDGIWDGPIALPSSDRVQMVDFLSTVVVGTQQDGQYEFDGGSLTAIADSPDCLCIAIWQNAIWSATGNRLTRSDLGQLTYPVTPVYNDIRDRDDTQITALWPSQGMDDQGRAGLLVFKESATFRVYDSTTGAYVTLSTDCGANGPLCVTSLYGNTYFINTKGIYGTDGLSKPQVFTEKLEPLFRPDQLDFASEDDWCAGVHQDRVLFAVKRTVSESGNDLILEMEPANAWIVPHLIPVTCFAAWTKEGRFTYHANPNNGHIYNTFEGWDDDGEDIGARWQSRWFEPGAGFVFRMRRLLVSGRGQFSLFVKANYSLGVGILCPVSIGGEEGLWGTGVWGTAIWGPLSYENYQSFHSLGIARSVSFVLSEESSTSEHGPKILGDGAEPQVGSIALYGLHLDVVPLTPA